jgi:hypothetical protein
VAAATDPEWCVPIQVRTGAISFDSVRADRLFNAARLSVAHFASRYRGFRGATKFQLAAAAKYQLAAMVNGREP